MEIQNLERSCKDETAVKQQPKPRSRLGEPPPSALCLYAVARSPRSNLEVTGTCEHLEFTPADEHGIGVAVVADSTS
jgi:hypothetical protein